MSTSVCVVFSLFLSVSYKAEVFYLLRFIPRHVTLLGSVVNSAVFFISLSDNMVILYIGNKLSETSVS